ncbi:hypothetical protein [Nodosilinea nodulosa]|uniref:hypothetical protein n=1 Tax=Nodosilinea nodulosa TaxID=416001 RepID=UPI0012D7C435|nr:hypothetical protein [Nodosilinea nodulosa]
MTPRVTAPSLPLSLSSLRSRARSRSWLGLACVVASLAAHGVLLALALPATHQRPDTLAEAPEPEAPAPENVAVTVLPKPVAEEVLAEPALVEATPAAPPVSPAPQAAAPATPESAPEPLPQTAAPAPNPAFEPPPAPPVETEPTEPSPYANFPHLEGAQTTCEGLTDCWRSPVSSSWRGAAGDLQERLEAQGYRVDNVTSEVLSVDSGVRVYAVSKPGEADYYLNLVSVQDGVLYTMTTAPITTEQVLALQRS